MALRLTLALSLLKKIFGGEKIPTGAIGIAGGAGLFSIAGDAGFLSASGF